MATFEKASDTLASENLRLKAQVAQLEDRLDHLAEQEGVSESLKRAAINQRAAERWHRSAMEGVSDVVLVANGSRRLTYVSPNVQRSFGYFLEATRLQISVDQSEVRLFSKRNGWRTSDVSKLDKW